MFAQAHAFLDKHFGLSSGAHYQDVQAASVDASSRLQFKLASGKVVGLDQDSQFVGFSGQNGDAKRSFLLRNNGLHVEIVVDPSSAIGRDHAAGWADVLLEAAITAIADCEDSVAAVDCEDKCGVYRNWAGTFVCWFVFYSLF